MRPLYSDENFRKIELNTRNKKKYDRGGTVIGRTHVYGGVKYVLENGREVELEDAEVIIPSDILNIRDGFKFWGTNREIIEKILGIAGLSLDDRATNIQSGDFVICRNSALDDSKRYYYRGRIPQILSAINQTNDCNIMERGAVVVALNNKKKNKLSDYYKKNRYENSNA